MSFLSNNAVMNGNVSKTETSRTLNKTSISAILQFLRRNNLKSAENALRSEIGLADTDDTLSTLISGESDESEQLERILEIYTQSEHNLNTYVKTFQRVQQFVNRSLDIYKFELGQVLFPVFVHMYLELVYNCHDVEARTFMQTFGPQIDDNYAADIAILRHVHIADHMRETNVVRHFRDNKFHVRLCMDSFVVLKRFMNEKSNDQLLRIIQQHVLIDVFDGVSRSQAVIRATSGALEGCASRQVNKTRMMFGLLKEPDFASTYLIDYQDDPDSQTTVQQSFSASSSSVTTAASHTDTPGDTGAGGIISSVSTDKSRRKANKLKKDSLVANLRKYKSDHNAPFMTRIPLPHLRDCDKRERSRIYREMSKRVNVGLQNPPSICFYTLMNCVDYVSCCTMSEDATMMAVGFNNSSVRVWSLLPHKLKHLKSADQLELLDKEADDVHLRMLDDSSGEQSRVLHGHGGAVYGLSFSPDKWSLLSCSADGTIRMWSLHTWTCLVIFKGHIFPVWSVCFSAYGHYFCSAGHDMTVRVWSTDQIQALRIMVGHYSDVDCVVFHPNCNYVASGSSDRSVRVWDISNGVCLRILTGHKHPITALTFSPFGRFLVSADSCGSIIVWEMSCAALVAKFSGSLQRNSEFVDVSYPVSCVTFSRDGCAFATGALDNSIQVWDFNKITDKILSDDASGSLIQSGEIITNRDGILVGRYMTKHTPLIALHFTRRNLLLGVGYFQSK